MGLLSESGVSVAQTTQTESAPTAPTTGNSTSTTPSWIDSLPEDIKGHASLKNFSDVGSLAKSYVHAQQLMGKKGVIVPTEKSSDEEWQSFYKELGVPEVDKYSLEAPKDKAVNEELLNKFKAEAAKNGLLPKQAQKMFDFLIGTEEEQMKSASESKAQFAEKSIGALKQEWGEAFDKKVDYARRAVNEFGGDELKQALKNAGLDNHPALVKAFAKAGAFIKEDSLKGDGHRNMSQTPEEIKREISEIMQDPSYSDKMHGNHLKTFNKVADLYKKLYG